MIFYIASPRAEARSLLVVHLGRHVDKFELPSTAVWATFDRYVCLSPCAVFSSYAVLTDAGEATETTTVSSDPTRVLSNALPCLAGSPGVDFPFWPTSGGGVIIAVYHAALRSSVR